MTRLIKTAEEIEILRQGGKILGEILLILGKMVQPGVTTGDLEARAMELITQAKGLPAFKGYTPGKGFDPYPTALCVSINDEIVHAPSLPSRELKNGDIVSIDAGLQYKGLFTDSAITVPVGEVPQGLLRLINTTQESLMIGIKQVKAGNTLDDIGAAIETFVKSRGYDVVRDLVGHGVGLAVHEEPQVPNFAIAGSGLPNLTLQSGMVLAIEPMVVGGSHEIELLEDGLTFATADGSPCAHFEHTVVVTEEGCEVITKVPSDKIQ